MKVFKNVSYDSVAKLIASNNIVALFQGRSEAGPRALGNRSFVFDPRMINGHYHINKVKGREWYRPVAGTILEENFEEYFHTNGLKSSPFMSYACIVKEEKRLDVNTIIHVDDTCRIQTVNQKQNYHYYNLISSFKNLTAIPCLGNTSLNLSGQPIAETLEDAIDMIKNSKIEFLYLPEIKKLIFSENN